MGYYDTYYRAVVQRTSRLSPSLVRVVLGAGDLGRWTSSGTADERLVLVFPRPGEREAPAPERLPDGTQDYPDAGPQPEMRSYTVRSFDPARAEMAVDFVAHEGGVAAQWALDARPGDALQVTEAAGWYTPPPGCTWQLLVADLTGLPALGRIVENLPAGTRAHVVAEVIDPGDRLEPSSAAEVTYTWLPGCGNGVAPSALPRAVRDLVWPEGPGYVWFAGEAAASRAVRKHLRHERGCAVADYRVLGYWRARQEEWMQRYEQVGAGLEAVYTDAVASGVNSTDALELYDDALERVGL